MSKKVFMSIVILLCVISVSFSIPASGMFGEDVIEKIRPAETDLPDGFVYGTVPEGAKSIFKANPWKMDQSAITRLTKEIYPDGNYQSVKAIHMSIITRKDRPFGDDLVCYIFVFKNNDAANREIKKLEQYALFNKDRQILHTKKNLAVVLMIDDVDDYSYIHEMSNVIKQKLDTL
ncbi:MAG: hypothetical protein JXK07_15830 [Spirochaetes bacterium]|nr:hypothetical protein [Spirochaetota bacterium]MBN2771343.1 hypothetical protein [Spirochaetota bacterium]